MSNKTISPNLLKLLRVGAGLSFSEFADGFGRAKATVVKYEQEGVSSPELVAKLIPFFEARIAENTVACEVALDVLANLGTEHLTAEMIAFCRKASGLKIHELGLGKDYALHAVRNGSQRQSRGRATMIAFLRAGLDDRRRVLSLAASMVRSLRAEMDGTDPVQEHLTTMMRHPVGRAALAARYGFEFAA